MRNQAKTSKRCYVAILGVTPLLLLGTGLRAQSQPAPNNRRFQDDDTTRKELAQFDQFLDGHQEIAKQIQQDPSLANNPEYLKNHPDLQTFLANQPQIREELKEDPNAFMRQENTFDRTGERVDNDGRRAQLAEFDRFLDSHPEIAEQLRKDPSLADKEQFLKTHPALQTYLQQQPAIRQDLKQNPDAFMRQEANFDRNDMRLDYDARRAHQEEFNRFLDGHREIAEQLRKDPSLADKEQFLKTHPALQSYLRTQPEIRQDLRQDPKAFMQQEDASDRQRSTFDRDEKFDSRRDADKDSRDFDKTRGSDHARDLDKTRDDDHTRDFDHNKAGQEFSNPAGVSGSSSDSGSSKPSAAASSATSGAASTTAPAPAPTKSGTKQ